MAFGALGEMVRMRAGILEIEDAGDLAGEVATHVLDEFVLDAEERRWVEPQLAHLLGLAERAARADRDEIVLGLAHFSSSGSPSTGLTVLVFEDLQWADAGLIDFVESILEWSRSSSDPRRHSRASRADGPPTQLGRRTSQLHLAAPRTARRRTR